MTKREKNIKEIFKDLKGRISGLPHLRNNPAVVEREGEVKANVVKQFLLEEHKIDIGLTALQERINRINAN